MREYIVAIDQGTTSTRAIVFTHRGRAVSVAQVEHEQIFPKPGWVEHDAGEIWHNTRQVVDQAVDAAGLSAHDIAAVGITNQRETVVVWDRLTGVPIAPAIVWQDTRTQDRIDALAANGGVGRFAHTTGLPLATYFSATKIAEILDTVPEARSRAAAGEILAGTIDSWLVWNLTGGPQGGRHLTDVTNASRTLLMDLETLQWSHELCAEFDVPREILPTIRSSSEVYGEVAIASSITGVPIAGILGDQQAATFGQAAFRAGDSKNTYGTGNFLLVSTGDEIVRSHHGLLTTVGYQLAGQPAHYALEGSVAVTGSLVQWLRDNLGIISASSEIEALAASVPDNGDVYIVPAFSGLFAPHWRPDARGVIVGLTRFATKAHIARAALEAVAFQTRDIIDAITAETGVAIPELRVDGGMVANELLMQFQADILGIPVVRPVSAETTALGAAYAAGLAVGVWTTLDELRAQWHEGARWQPRMASSERTRLMTQWTKAVERTLDWA